MAMKSPIKKVSSLSELGFLARKDPRYHKLAIISSRNLGGTHGEEDLSQALNWLDMNAMETDEKGVVREVNACRNFVK